MAIKNSTVNSKLAQDCIDRYGKMYKQTADRAVNEAFTSSVTFSKADLLDWLNTQTAETVELSLGVYTKEFAAVYPKAVPGRLTVFLYCCGDGVGAVKAHAKSLLGDPGDQPLNLGDVSP